MWIIFRTVENKDNKNAEIIVKALESNSAVDTDKLVAALGKREKTPAQLLQMRLLRGCIFTFLGIATAILTAVVYSDMLPGEYYYYFPLAVSVLCFPVGIAYLVVYFMTRKSVRKE